MKAVAKYFWVVAALFVVQVGLGGDHRALRGRRPGVLRLQPVGDPALQRDAQLAHAARVFWIATAWLATGLYIAPAISGHEPKFQRLGVNFLFGCLLDHRGRRARRPVVRRDAEARTRARTSGSVTRATSTSTSAASGRSSCSSA
jgi:hypothetical protein